MHATSGPHANPGPEMAMRGTGSKCASSATATRPRATRPDREPTHPPLATNWYPSGSGSRRLRPVEDLVRPVPIPQALQQPLRHVLQRAEQLHRRSLALLLGQPPQQAPLLHQLQQQVGDLQQEIVRRPAGMAVGMFQVQATVLLGVESLVLRRQRCLPPSVATSTTVWWLTSRDVTHDHLFPPSGLVSVHSMAWKVQSRPSLSVYCRPLTQR